jgi:CP family cyanate transporter-like MFS transporter
MMQSIGYVIAGVGPLVFGALHSATNSWRGPLIFVLALLAPQLWAGLRASAPIHLADVEPSADPARLGQTA